MARPNNHICNLPNILQYPRCRKSRHPQTLAFKKHVPLFIPLWTIAHVVRNPVNLDHQLRRSTIEVENLGAIRMLAAEFYPLRFGPEDLPQHNFRQRHIAAQHFRLANSLPCRSSRHCPSVRPAACHLPMPAAQGGLKLNPPRLRSKWGGGPRPQGVVEGQSALHPIAEETFVGFAEVG